MKNVKFIQDYQGVLTGEQFYREGREAEFPAGQADALVEQGRAVYMDAPKPEKNPEIQAPARKKKVSAKR